jgi:hypothetical protein
MGNQIGAQNARTGPMGMARETTSLRKENQELMLAQQAYQYGDIYGAQRHEQKAAAFGAAAEAQHTKRFYGGKTVVPWAHPSVNTMPIGQGLYNTSFGQTAVPAMPMSNIGYGANYGGYNTGLYNGTFNGLNASAYPGYSAVNGGFTNGLSSMGGLGMNGMGMNGLGLNSGVYGSTIASPMTSGLGLGSTMSAPMASGAYW